MRINVYLAKRFGISRREGDKLIRAGKVTINGFLAEVGQDINDDETIDHKVTIDGHIRPTVSQKLVRRAVD